MRGDAIFSAAVNRLARDTGTSTIWAGDGKGMVSRRAAALGASGLVAPSFHDDRLRHIPDGQLFATITNGVRNMPSYAHNIPVDDRWAIVQYVRALQLSQAPVAALKNTEQSK